MRQNRRMSTPRMFRTLWPALALLVAGAVVGVVARADDGAAAPAAEPAGRWASLEPGTKVGVVNAAVLGFIAAWGLVYWDYGVKDWSATDEGWFGADTNEGGADKAGHLYTSYVLGRSLTGTFRSFGYDPHKAAWAGAASSLAAMTFMEFGDGFSPYGFSKEDEVMNVAGAGIAWLLAANPSLDRKFALRGEYRVNTNHTDDVLTDYDRWRYYATVKLDGFDGMPRALRWVELHAGYYVRGYADTDPANDRRASFVGIGLSLTKFARERGWKKTGVVLDYFQPPDTVLRADNDR